MRDVWIVDDDESIRFILEKVLIKNQISVKSFTDAESALKALQTVAEQERPAVILSDIRMAEVSGIALLHEVKEQFPDIPVIIMTAYSDLDSTVSAFQGGAFDYLSKPFDLVDMIELVRRAMDESLRSEQKQDIDKNFSVGGRAEGLIGNSPAMQEIFKIIGRLSQSSATVLVTGESGTGKEMIAQALHQHSPNASGPFVAINTAAIPKELLESELFGHERGAFTGAQAQHRGHFEQAAGGTLFLDEIGDMSLELQTRLLRVLSSGNFYRVGGKEAIQSRVRVVAATHQNLEGMVEKGLFREDLYHRLNVIRLRLPTLNERREDIPLFVAHFLEKSAQQQKMALKRVSKEAMEVLKQYSYPGNVRQLENICHWLTVMTPTQEVEVKDLPVEIRQQLEGQESISTLRGLSTLAHSAFQSEQANFSADGERPSIVPALDRDGEKDWMTQLEADASALLEQNKPHVWDELSRLFEASLLRAALKVSSGKRAEAASRLGIGRNTVTRKLKELGLNQNDDDE